MINLLIRTFIIYIAVIAVMRLMGKRQIGQLQPFEMVITIIIADLAAMPMQDERIPLLRGIIPLVVLLLSQVVFSYIIFRNKRFRNWINGTPSILIAHGKINHMVLQHSMISFSDIVEAMHSSGISDIGEVDFAVLETNGSINFFQKPEFQATQKSDINADVSKNVFSCPLVMNGRFLPNYMQFCAVTAGDVMQKLDSEGRVLDDIIFSYLDSEGNIQIIYKEEKQ